MELLLHYVWHHRLFPLAPLLTTDGQPVEVIDPGLPNRNAGPDFFNAKLKIGGTLWVGNVEIHQKASDWMRHGHTADPAYANVILHVVGEEDCRIELPGGEVLPQLVLRCPADVEQRYDELQHTRHYPPCYAVIPRLPRLTVHSWLSALHVERLERKSLDIARRLEQHANHWEDVFFVTLARNFGFGVNADAFEAWAGRIPFRAVDKHRDDLFQIEAIFFGQAGLLEADEPADDAYYQRLRQEFRYLQRKFDLPRPLDAAQWRFLRLRPANFPHVRLAQLAALYQQGQTLFSRLMEAETTTDTTALLQAGTSDYWHEHYSFGHASPRRTARLGAKAIDLLLINTVVPFLYAYGRHRGDESLCERATRFIESIKAEDNHIVRLWSEVGLPVTSAADSQALIQLRTAYCDRKDCLRCRFGYEYLKRVDRTPSSQPPEK